MDIQWGDAGLVHDLFEPTWKRTKVGDVVDVVIDVHTWGHKVALGRAFPSGQVLRILGNIPFETCGFPRVTFLGLSVAAASPLVDLTFETSSDFFGHPPMEFEDLFNTVDFCSGIACSAFGFQKAGFLPKVAVEKQPKLVQLLQRVHPGISAILGDVTDATVSKQIWDACPAVGTGMAGIACQPYSRGGNMGGALDSRSSTLPGVLKLTSLLQLKILVVECVVPARSNSWVRKHFQALADELGFHVTETVYRLEDCWASCRERWWVVCTHPCLGPIALPDMPKGNPLTVRTLLPFVKEWPQEQLQQLLLTEHEVEVFTHQGQSLRKYQVKQDSKLPTALHSWGNQAVPCACECRSKPLSDELLHGRGVFAQLLPVLVGGQQKWRHLHVIEVAILTGVPPGLDWSPDQRLNLCAIGQQASPIQAVWVAAHIHLHIRHLLNLPPCVQPMECLQALKRQLWQEAEVFFPPVVAQVPQLLTVPIHVHADVGPLQISCPVGTTVAKLLSAERLLGADSHILACFQMPTLEPLTQDHVLDGRPVLVCPPWMLAENPAQPVSLAQEPGYEIPLIASTQLDVTEEPVADHLDCLVSGETALVPYEPEVPSSTEVLEGCDACMQALLQLLPNQFLALSPPLVSDQYTCHRLRNEVIPGHVRLALLDKQASVWADDEVLWHLERIALSCSSPITVVDPLLMHGLLMQVASTSAFELAAGTTSVITAVFLNGHWIPCAWTKRNEEMVVQMWEFGEEDLNFLHNQHLLMKDKFQVNNFTIFAQRRDSGTNTCGAATVAFFDHLLCGAGLPSVEERFVCKDLEFRQLFRSYLNTSSSTSRPWAWGAGPSDPPAIVVALLQLHGVPPAVSTNRAKLLLQSVGKDTVMGAVQGPTPWKSLKHVANQISPPFQLVLPEELAKKTQAQPTKTSKRKGTHANASGPLRLPTEVDPSKLCLEPGTFRCGHDEPLNQVSITLVGPLAVGIALTTMTEAKPFLQSGRLLTVKSLALLILNGPSDLDTQLQWNTVRFAAKCTANNEPVLLSGILVQLGQQPAYLHCAKDGVAVPQVDVACCRITVFADQFDNQTEGAWEEFCSHPVKTLLQHLEPLQACSVQMCTCPKWHSTETSEGDAVLDVFRRQFFNESGRPVHWSKSDQYGVMFRYHKSQELSLLCLSGTNGIYVEPRAEDGTNASLEFQVVWLTSHAFQDVQHKAQVEVHSLGIARNGSRYGIRVKACHFQSVFQALKPDALFLPPGPRSTWQCGPWPYGMDRKSLGAVFKKWGWAARPVQPDRSIPGGMLWKVQAIQDPPCAVYCLQHGQVVISRASAPAAQEPTASVVAGPNSTIRLCTAQSSSVDPLQAADPWKSALTNHGTVVAAKVDTKSQLQEIEERLEKAILEKLPQPNMDVDTQEDRISALESKFNNLMARQQSLEGAVQEQQVQQSQQLQTFQSQMMNHMDSQAHQLKGMFDDQMARMEAILAKKGRYE